MKIQTQTWTFEYFWMHMSLKYLDIFSIETKIKFDICFPQHIRITFSSSYYKYTYSSDINKYYYIFRHNF